MKRIFAAVFIFLATAFHGTASAADLSKQARSVVKLFNTNQGWDMTQPWTKLPASKSTCSAFFIAEGILTNAHCVAESTFIEAELPGLSDKVEVEVVAINHQTDLALLRLRRAAPLSFKPISFDDLPRHREKVVTVGYPTGGRQISFTEGVVSRIDVMRYAHSGLPSLMVQTDAAINPGNSGGPVFSDSTGECLGVATQKSSSGEGLGYFVPVPVIRQFLKDVSDGKTTGIVNLGVTLQTLENEAIRRAYGMKPEETGMRVQQVVRGASADGVLEVGDVLLSLDGLQVFNDGRVPFREDSKIAIGYVLTSRQVGDQVKARVLRGGKRLDLSIPLRPYRHTVIPHMPAYGEQPRYVLKGGLVILAVESRYLWRWGGADSDRLPSTLLPYLSMPVGEEDLEELVVISQVLDSSANKGYGGNVENLRIEKVNGVEIHSLSDAQKALSAPVVDGYLRLELENGAEVVLDEKQLAAEEEAIRGRYNIK